jgi:hypothetical protein
VDAGCRLAKRVDRDGRASSSTHHRSPVRWLVDIMVISGAIAKTLMLLRPGSGRTEPSVLFEGLFSAPDLGWPHGVQEEDRDRLWSWDPPPLRSDARPIEAHPQLPKAELIDLVVGGVPVRPVRPA